MNSDKYPKNVRVVKYNSLSALYELATARVWIDDFRKKYMPRKKANQVYFQLWHGSIALKKIERDILDKLPEDYIKEAIRDGAYSDFMVSGSTFMTNLYKKSFWFSGDILEFGTPSLDSLKKNNNDEVNKIFSLKDENILLYAPTFRNSENKDIYNIPFLEIIRHLENSLGGNWKCIIKLHPNDQEFEKRLVDGGKIISGSTCSDIQMIINRSNLIITDYSSVMFDAILNNKKVLLYTPDYENYLNNERGFYFKFSELPFPQALNLTDLYSVIDSFDNDKYFENIKIFDSKIGRMENGNASYRTAKYIVEKIINLEGNSEKK